MMDEDRGSSLKSLEMGVGVGNGRPKMLGWEETWI